MGRRRYLDWLRGLAVLIMVETHLFDSWVRAIDRPEPAYRWAMAIGGYSAPLFLFLAGTAMALAAGSRQRRSLSPPETARLARRRGWQILGLAFLFRLQSFLISGGPFPESLLKVDILNVMGLSMLLAAVLWGAGSRETPGVAAFPIVATCLVLLTPLVRDLPWVEALPYPIEWYFRPVQGSGAFTLFPWAAFLLFGVVVGFWLDRAQTDGGERRLMKTLAVTGPLLALVAYLATFLPPLYPGITFWTGSPTFFFVRLGVLITAIPFAYGWNTIFRGWSPLGDFGVASLFVYWVHVEMVYGVASIRLHKALTFEQALLSYVVFSLCLLGLVRMKDRILQTLAPTRSLTLAPSNTG